MHGPCGSSMQDVLEHKGINTIDHLSRLPGPSHKWNTSGPLGSSWSELQSYTSESLRTLMFKSRPQRKWGQYQAFIQSIQTIEDLRSCNMVLRLRVCLRVSLNSLTSRPNGVSFRQTHYLIHINIDSEHRFVPIEANVFSRVRVYQSPSAFATQMYWMMTITKLHFKGWLFVIHKQTKTKQKTKKNPVLSIPPTAFSTLGWLSMHIQPLFCNVSFGTVWFITFPSLNFVALCRSPLFPSFIQSSPPDVSFFYPQQWLHL